MSNQQKPLWKKLLPLFFILGFLLLLFFLFQMQSGQSNKRTNNNHIAAQNTQPAVIAPTVTRQTLKAGEEESDNPQGIKNQQVNTKDVDLNNPPTTYQTNEGYIVEMDNGKRIIKDRKGVVQNSVPNDFTKAEQNGSLDLSKANIQGTKPYSGKRISDKTPTAKELQIPLDSGIGQLTQYLSSKNKDLSTVFPLNGVSFEKGNANFVGTSKEHLNYLLKMLENYPDVHLKFMGHVSNSGDVTADRALSGKRAYSVKKYLVDNGIDYERLRHERYGSDHPLANKGSADAEAMNNRIVMMISRR